MRPVKARPNNREFTVTAQIGHCLMILCRKDRPDNFLSMKYRHNHKIPNVNTKKKKKKKEKFDIRIREG